MTVPKSVQKHYKIEKELAAKLKSAPSEERPVLYQQLYNELFRRVPDHPQIHEQKEPQLIAQKVRNKMKLVSRYLQPSMSFLEIGAGDLSFATEVAKRVKQVVAIDVSKVIAASKELPKNIVVKITDGISLDIPENSIDVAYSNQLMEHLHPDDAKTQLQNVYTALKPGGVYICITPSRVSGPHDVSQYFDDVAQGFHLKEYTYKELLQLFRKAGFNKFRAYIGGKGWYLRTPLWFVRAKEIVLQKMPKSSRQSSLAKAILGINLAAYK